MYIIGEIFSIGHWKTKFGRDAMKILNELKAFKQNICEF